MDNSLFKTRPWLLIFFFGVAMNVLAQDRPQIIFDTDFGGDADDLGALAMLHNFMSRGECNLLVVFLLLRE